MAAVFHLNVLFLSSFLRFEAFVPTSLFFELFRSFHSHRFSISDMKFPPDSSSVFCFLCLMQTSSEAGYCVIRISQNRCWIYFLRDVRRGREPWCYPILATVSEARILWGENFSVWILVCLQNETINRVLPLIYLFFCQIHSINLLSLEAGRKQTRKSFYLSCSFFFGGKPFSRTLNIPSANISLYHFMWK